MQEGDIGDSGITWNPKNTFTGTAWYYSRYRPGYPEQLFQLLQRKFSLDLSSRILDLGCGTGQIALSVSSLAKEVVAMDRQEEMLNEARSLATANNIINIRWLSGESGDLLQLADSIGMVDLTVIARAFHWMDKKQVLRELYPLTKPGGGIAIISDNDLRSGLKTPWKEAIDQVIRRWLGEERKAGTDGTYSHPTIRFDEYLKESAFRDVEIAAIHVERMWTIDKIVGYLYSTSYSSPSVLGGKKELFEAEIRKNLKELEPSGKFRDPVIIEIMMGCKPPL